jgi:hypothetical protein
MRPPKIKRPPKVMAYAVTTHCTEAPPKPNARWIEGRATLTMLKSKTTMNDASRTKVSADVDSPADCSFSLSGSTDVVTVEAISIGERALLKSLTSRISL